MPAMFSIDQNCHSLWDVLPKLQALARRGLVVTQYVEDVDAAFTELGSAVAGSRLRLARERFHHSGGEDWGAGLFYTHFLGRLSVDLRLWEPLLGMRISALAKRLNRSVGELYAQYSPGDTWQLIGPSYVGDREHHRVMGDLSVAETAGFLRQVLQQARQEMLHTFPAADSHARLGQWFDAEHRRVEALIARHSAGRLCELYCSWLGEHVGGQVGLDRASALLALEGDPARLAVLELFLKDYDLAAGLYNQAVGESHVGLHELASGQGELPFFAVLAHQGHLVRVQAWWRGGKLLVDQREYACPRGQLPVQQLQQAGVQCLAGKAIVLVIQVRLGSRPRMLALPYRGSADMPAAHLLAQKLLKHGLLAQAPPPVMRVRFGLLDRLAGVRTPIRLSPHLAGELGEEEVPASRLGEAWSTIAAAAKARLALLGKEGLRAWHRQNLPELAQELEELDARRRELARFDPKGQDIRDLWNVYKSLQAQALEQTLRQLDADWQLAQLEYFDSRGALLPWSMALGGLEFYHALIEQARIYPETH